MPDLSRRTFTLGLLASAAAVPAVAGAVVEDPFLVGVDAAANPDITAIAVFRWDGDESILQNGTRLRWGYIVQRVVPVVDGVPVVSFDGLPKDREIEMQIRHVYRNGMAGPWSIPQTRGEPA